MSYKRIVISYILILSALFFCVLRICTIALTPSLMQTANEITSKKIILGNVRGTIYDCNLVKLTNNTGKYANIITDDPKAINMISEYFNGEETVEIINDIRKNKFAIKITDRPINEQGIISLPFNSTISADTSAKHIIGFIDENNKGVSGLEMSYNDILSSNKQVYIDIGVDGQGGLLLSTTKIENSKAFLDRGIVTTLDSRIQNIAEKASNKLKCGAVIITEISSGKIRAMVSRPDFNPENISDSLNDENKPLINRALLCYNVGSVFKPCVAAAALENGYNNFSYNCSGVSTIDGLSFHCHKLSGHGSINLGKAIKFSCNTFFYNFAISIGAEKIINIAKKAGFDKAIPIANKLYTSKGNIGDKEKIVKSMRATANLSIGQGELLLSPVGISTLYSAIANKGIYYPPTIYEGEFQNNKIIRNKEKISPVKLMSEDTANTIKEYLKGVLDEDGTGFSAKPKMVSAAGKTATAETGIIKNGQKVINTWFCGFFPFENPQYVVIVLAENSSISCGDVFSSIADEMYLN